MNTNWKNRPTHIDEIPIDINWIIAIDESGNPDLKYLYKQKNKNNCVNEGDKHFTVTACALKTADFISTRDKIMDLKNKYWENALYKYNGIEKRVCLHSKEIRERKNAFNKSVIEYDNFIIDLSNMMSSLPITLFSAHIDKWKHINKYKYPVDPYDLCLNFITERIVCNMGENETCYIVLESRGKREDKNLLKVINRILRCGNGYKNSSFFSKIKGVYFNPKWCKESDNKKSYWELEIADICAFPIHKYLSYGKTDKSFEVLESKLYGYPHTKGYGIKTFP